VYSSAVTGTTARDDGRRRLPSVDEVLREPRVRALSDEHGREAVVRCVRLLLDELRRGGAADLDRRLGGLPAELEARLAAAGAPSLVRVINATGVVIHTNLGRAPLPADAAARVAEIGAGYSNLELDLPRGERGDREVHAETRLRALLGAEAAVVVNNNAAAVLLAVNTLAEGREVLVSRGELVEIGGSFRIPEVLRKGGAVLREVGTTNRTRIADYRAAIGERTALVLKVHPSNFRILGFTEAPALAELVALARDARLPLVEDLGSGRVGPLPEALRSEPSVAASLEAGVDLVTFSGDKLVGGPQAGLAVGRGDVVHAMRRNALYRALRVDKMTMAALDAVLRAHQSGRGPTEVPVTRMLWRTAEEVRARAEAAASALRERCPGLEAAVIPGSSAVGGGAAPTVELDTFLLAIGHAARPPDVLAAALRAGRPPVVARVAEDRLVLDLRTVEPDDEPGLLDALERALV
jgi:L-seryl-tRNA(Ser) seleniumtransferase